MTVEIIADTFDSFSMKVAHSIFFHGPNILIRVHFSFVIPQTHTKAPGPTYSVSSRNTTGSSEKDVVIVFLLSLFWFLFLLNLRAPQQTYFQNCLHVGREIWRTAVNKHMWLPNSNLNIAKFVRSYGNSYVRLNKIVRWVMLQHVEPSGVSTFQTIWPQKWQMVV